MPRLLVNPRSPNPWQIELKSGPNLLGRGVTNDFAIDDPSVSSSHCQILVDQTNVLIKDLGSTNGTFVDRAPVTEAPLRPGQTIHLGQVEILFQPEALAAIRLTPANPESPPRMVGPTSSPARTAPPLITTDPSNVTAAPPHKAAPLDTGAHYCKFHKQTPARFLCDQCDQFFCGVCVGSRNVGGMLHHTCRHCGAECIPVQVHIAPTVEKGFFARLPGAFAYPLRGAGVVVIVVGIVVLSMLRFGGALFQYAAIRGSIRALIFAVILSLCAGGYLFTYLQSIVHSTVAEEKELPDLPGIGNFVEDVFFPFFRLFGLFLLCFGAALGLGVWAAISKETTVVMSANAMLAFGYVYFPMAFLAVAVLDSMSAANPLVIVTSIVKAPFHYLFTIVFLALPWAFWLVAAALMSHFFAEGWVTHSMSKLFLMIASMGFTAFTAFYLLVVGVHLLGLLYVTKKSRFGWLGH